MVRWVIERPERRDKFICPTALQIERPHTLGSGLHFDQRDGSASGTARRVGERPVRARLLTFEGQIPPGPSWPFSDAQVSRLIVPSAWTSLMVQWV